MPGYIFGGDTGWSYEELQRRRKMADALSGQIGTPRDVGEGLAAIGKALMVRGLNKRADKEEGRMRGEFDDMWAKALGGTSGGSLGGGYGSTSSYEPPAPATEAWPLGERVSENEPAKPMWPTGESVGLIPPEVRAGIFKGESGGDFNALFGYSNRPGGKFANVTPTNMTVGQVLDFTNPSGEYGQWVKGQVGRVATPVGGYQIVGSTLRDAVKNGVVSPDERFSEATQHKIADWIYKTQGTGAWEGYKGPVYDTTMSAKNAPQPLGTASGADAPQPLGTASPGAAPMPAGGLGDAGAWAEIMSSPFASPGQKAIAQAMLGRALQPPADPMDAQMRQMELERAQLELNALRNPTPKDTRTDDMREYDFAVSQGYEGSFWDFLTGAREAGASSTNIDLGNNFPELGKLPQGYGYVLDPNTQRPVIDPQTGLPRAAPIPGSPQQQEEAAAAAAAEAKKTQKQAGTSIVMDEIGLAKELIGGESVFSPATGITGGIMSMVDSSRAGQLKNRLETIKANIGFDKLQAMRDASPTGGALGQVSEFENRLLQAVFGSLEQSQTAEDLTYNLDRLQNLYMRIINEGIPDDEARREYMEIRRGAAGGGSNRFSGMTRDELMNVDIDTLSGEEFDAFERRWAEVFK